MNASSSKNEDSKSNVDINSNGLVFRKNKARVTLDKTVSVQENDKNEENNTRSKELKYSIRSVVHHIGSTAFSGHYTTDGIRTKHSQGESSLSSSQAAIQEWIAFDDGVTTALSEKDALKSANSQNNAYMVLYELENQN
eukprot:10904960-Ditylum_brightwellii.AAC.1